MLQCVRHATYAEKCEICEIFWKENGGGIHHLEKNNIEKGVKDLGREDMNWIQLNQLRDH
jgi:hypothetical protein